MPGDIDRFVAENRERIRQVGGRFIEVDSARDRDLSFGPSKVTVDVSATVYKRSTGSQIIVGHDDDAHGFGRGTFGDDKGEWIEAGSNVSTVTEFTKQGRRAVVRALDGQAGAVTTAKAGTDNSDPVTSDTDLTAVYAESPTVNTQPSSNDVRAAGAHDAVDWVGDPIEFGIYDGSDRLLARVVVNGTWSIATDDDVRVDVTLSFVGDGIGNSVITADGEAAIADAIADTNTVTGPVEFGFGSGSTSFAKSDSSLTSEEFRKACERNIDRDRVNAKTHVFEAEPSGQMPVDLSEMAVFDNNGRMIWATTFRSFTKRDSAGFNAESLLQVS